MRWLFVFGTALVISMAWLFAGLALISSMFDVDPKGGWTLIAYVCLFAACWPIGLRLFARPKGDYGDRDSKRSPDAAKRNPGNATQ